MRRSGSGDPELQSPASNLAHRDNLANPAPLWLQTLGARGRTRGPVSRAGGMDSG